MNRRFLSCFAISAVSGISAFAGCGYEPPDVTNLSSSGSGQGGKGGGASSVSSSGQSSSSGQAGSGGQGDCDISAQPKCEVYTGPAGTENVGLCRASRSTCMAEGTWSGCDVEVIPTYESCANDQDVNCDGAVPCTGQPIAPWNVQNPQSNRDELIVAVATSAGKNNGRDGNVYAVGVRAATLAPPPVNDANVLMWRRTPDGIVQNWSDSFVFMPSAQTNGAVATSVIVLPKSGEVVVGGFFFGGALDIGKTGGVTANGKSSFLARFNPTGGLLQTLFITTGGELVILGLTADSEDKVYIAGQYSGAPVIDGNKLGLANDLDGFVAALTPSLGYRWNQVFKGAGTQSVEAIATISDTSLAVAATFVGAMTVATINGPQTPNAGLEPDIATLALDAVDGRARWAQVIEGSGIAAKLEVAGLAANASTVVVGGRFMGALNLQSSPYISKGIGTYDSFVAKIPAGGGNITQHYVSQAEGSQELRSVTLDPDGKLILAGYYSQQYPMPGKALNSSNGTDAFVLKTDENLTALWAQSFGDGAYQGAFATTVGKTTGDIYVGGAFQGNMAIGSTMLMSAGGTDAFLMQLGD